MEAERFYKMPYMETEEGIRVISYNIRRLWAIHKKICLLVVEGLKPKDIAEICQVTVQTVYNTMNSDLGRGEIDRLSMKVEETALERKERIDRLASFSLDFLEEVLLEEDDERAPIPVKVGIAQSMVDRAGHVKGGLVQSTVGARITDDFLAEVEKKAQAIRNGERKELLRAEYTSFTEVIEKGEKNEK
jgi:hypothetical protein